jgi:hypothetical protein
MDQQLFVKMALQGWNTQVARAEKYFNALSEAISKKRWHPTKTALYTFTGTLPAIMGC